MGARLFDMVRDSGLEVGAGPLRVPSTVVSSGTAARRGQTDSPPAAAGAPHPGTCAPSGGAPTERGVDRCSFALCITHSL